MLVKTLTVGPIGTNCYILCDRQGGQAAVIDPGAEPGRILAALGETGCWAVYVLLTHGHFDHIGAAEAVIKETGATLAACAGEAELLRDPALNLSAAFTRSTQPPLAPGLLLHEGESLSVGGLTVGVIETPGHTSGSCCYLCGDLIFSGDTLFKDGAGRTDFPTGSFEQLARSLKRLAALEGDRRVCPGHGEPTTLGRERQINPWMRKDTDEAFS